MGRRRPHLLFAGVAVLAAVLGGTDAASSSPGPSSVIRAEVTATGHPVEPAAGWRVRRLTVGVYRVTVPGEDIVLDVPLWDAVAEVTVLPLGRGATEIRFALDGRPVDTAFDFVTLGRR